MTTTANPSMQTIAQSSIRPADDFTRPFRVTMRLNSQNSITPYVVNLETDPDTDGAAYCHGDYCENQLKAFDAYVARCARYGVTALDAMGKKLKSRD